MIQIVWEFIVKAEATPQFQRTYGPDGDWARLFRQYPGYRGTSLLRDAANPRRFLTIDHWETQQHVFQMRDGSTSEYSRLAVLLADLTESERELGVFEST